MDRQADFINVLTRNMLDICELVRFFSKCFKKANPVNTVVTNGSNKDDDKSARGGSGRNIF